MQEVRQRKSKEGPCLQLKHSGVQSRAKSWGEIWGRGTLPHWARKGFQIIPNSTNYWILDKDSSNFHKLPNTWPGVWREGGWGAKACLWGRGFRRWVSRCTRKVNRPFSINVFIKNYVSLLGLAESRLSSEEGVGRVERERRTEEPRQGRGGRGAGKEKDENVVSEKETEKRGQRRIKLDKIENKQPHWDVEMFTKLRRRKKDTALN